MSAAPSIDAARAFLEGIVRAAEADGLIITIEQVPLKPLAMGHYTTVVSVQPKRVPS